MENRLAYSPAEFGALFGKSQAWSYRLISSKQVKVITQFGNKMIPITEVERILNSADLDPPIPKDPNKRGRGRPPKRNKMIARQKLAWAQYLKNLREMKTDSTASDSLANRQLSIFSKHLPHRSQVFGRLGRKK